MIKKIMITLILFVLLTGCTMQSEDTFLGQNTIDPAETIKTPTNQDDPEINPIEKQEIVYTLGTPKILYEPRPPYVAIDPDGDSDISLSYYTNYEDYFNTAFPYRDYDETYFLNKDLLVVEAFTHIYGVTFETQDLQLENNILTINVLQKAPSIHLCVYLPRFVYFYLEFDKIEQVDELKCNHQVRYDYETYYLPNEQDEIEEKLADQEYLDVTVGLSFAYQDMSIEGKETYIEQKISQWVEDIFDNNLQLIDITHYGFSIYVRLYRLESTELNQLLLCLEDDDLQYLTVGFRNF